MTSLNPPTRLLRLLEEVTSTSGDMSTRQLWATVFSLEPTETVKILA